MGVRKLVDMTRISESGVDGMTSFVSIRRRENQ